MRTNLLLAAISEALLIGGIIVFCLSLHYVGNGPCIVYTGGPPPLAAFCADYAINTDGLYSTLFLLSLSALFFGYLILRIRKASAIPPKEATA